MKSIQLRKCLIGLGIAFLTIAIGGYVTFNWVTDYLLRSIATNISFQTVDTIVPSITQLDTSDSNGKGKEKPTGMIDGKVVQSGGLPSILPSNPYLESKDTANKTPIQVFSTTTTTSIANTTSPQPTPYDGEITIEKVDQAQAEITQKDKALVASILLKRLSPSDIQVFTKMMSGGMTLEEKKQAKEIILSKLSADEYNQLIAIAAKLGLSQGENYQNSLRDLSPTPAGTNTPRP